MSLNTATALRIFGTGDQFRSELQSIKLEDPKEGEVLVKVEYSSVNYKDALAGTGKGPILRTYPLTGGIDLAGVVSKSQDSRFKEGDSVLITGCSLSETKNGGYSNLQLVKAMDLVHLPRGLTTRQAMIIGTAGFTAALSLYRMEQNGLSTDQGAVLITGATGGVGSLAINIFSQAQYQVSALSRKTNEFEWLKSLGAIQCIEANSYTWGHRPMETHRWSAALDNLGGNVLSGILKETQPWGHVALCGMAAGTQFNSSVMPFIIRGISLLGINSSACPMVIREELWEKLSTSWKPDKLEKIHRHSCTLDTIDSAFNRLIDGNATGRTLVELE